MRRSCCGDLNRSPRDRIEPDPRELPSDLDGFPGRLNPVSPDRNLEASRIPSSEPWPWRISVISSPSTSITVDGSAGVCSASMTTSTNLPNASRISSASRHGSCGLGDDRAGRQQRAAERLRERLRDRMARDADADRAALVIGRACAGTSRVAGTTSVYGPGKIRCASAERGLREHARTRDAVDRSGQISASRWFLCMSFAR